MLITEMIVGNRLFSSTASEVPWDERGETTVDPRTDASVRLPWQAKNAKAKAVPTLEAVRLMLAWTGWREVLGFSDYRPGSSEVVLLCEKDELVEGTGYAASVAPHRRVQRKIFSSGTSA